MPHMRSRRAVVKLPSLGFSLIREILGADCAARGDGRQRM